MIYECAGSVCGGGTQNSCKLMSLWRCSPGILFAVVSISRLNFFRFERVSAARDQWNNECQSRSAGTFFLFYFQVGGRLVISTSIYLLLLIIFTTQTEFQLTTREGIQHSISSRGRRWLVYLTLLARIGHSSDDLWVGRTELRKLAATQEIVEPSQCQGFNVLLAHADEDEEST